MNKEATAIIRQLEKIGDGMSSYQIFDDWLDVVLATLERLPEHLKSAINKQPLTDTPETVALWEKLNKRYTPYSWERFSGAFAELLNSTWQFHDTIGDVYMEYGIYNKNSGQFFTPFDLAAMMASIVISPENVYERIQAAYEKSRYGAMHKLISSERIPSFVRSMGEKIIPYCAEYIEPFTVHDPACGSGVMFLAAAAQFETERWMLAYGLVQFCGMDIDATCVRMAKVNMMLYGLNGYSIKCANALSNEELRTVPEPYQSKYAQAIAHPEEIPAITEEIRSWKQPSLF